MEEIKALIKVWLSVLISLLYTYFLVSKLPKGYFRLFSLLPIFYLFTILPLSHSTPTPSGLSGFFFTWLANFKLLLFAFDHGPLSHDLPKKSIFAFIFVAAFPIKIKQEKTHEREFYQSIKSNSTRIQSKPDFKNEEHKKLPLWSKALIYAILVVGGLFSNYNKNVNHNILLGIYCCVIYLNLETILGFYNKLVGSMLGVELCKPFDEPYLSTSLQDFWGRRWNLMVSDVLRHTIYFPTRAILEFHIGKRNAQVLATMFAFVVSGLMHELLFYYITRASPTWEVTCFFLLHGVCLAVEIWLKRVLGLGHKWALHWAVAGPLTLGFVIGTGFWLFLPQLVRNKVDERSLEEAKVVGRFFQSLLGWFLSS